MEYSKLLDLSTELAYQLAMCGAETFRVEESVIRIMAAYDIEAEVFALPNCIHISIEPVIGRPLTRMRRISFQGNDLDSVERFTSVSRRICSERPAPEIAEQWLKKAISDKRTYSKPIYYFGCFIAAFGFCLLFNGNISEALVSGLCGIVIGLINQFIERFQVNQFFRIITSSFIMSMVAYAFSGLSLVANADNVIAGAVMSLVPGLLFTNAMRDIIYGDTYSGINRVVQVLLIGMAIALGTAAAWNVSAFLWGSISTAPVGSYSILAQCIFCIIGGTGFMIIFNIHGKGMLLCALGTSLTWLVYALCEKYGGDVLAAYFWGTLFAAGFSEVMARIRKYPAISYLVVSIFPLIPGAGVYFAANYAVKGDMAACAAQSLQTASIAGVMAVAILLGSTTARIITTIKSKKAGVK